MGKVLKILNLLVAWAFLSHAIYQPLHFMVSHSEDACCHEMSSNDIAIDLHKDEGCLILSFEINLVYEFSKALVNQQIKDQPFLFVTLFTNGHFSSSHNSLHLRGPPEMS